MITAIQVLVLLSHPFSRESRHLQWDESIQDPEAGIILMGLESTLYLYRDEKRIEVEKDGELDQFGKLSVPAE